jgi:cell division septation protein DedD
VQISSATSEEGAWSSWKKILASHKVLSGEKPNVVKADLGSKGIFYRVRLGGFNDQSDAKAKCAKLKAGGVGCYVSKAAG